MARAARDAVPGGSCSRASGGVTPQVLACLGQDPDLPDGSPVSHRPWCRDRLATARPSNLPHFHWPDRPGERSLWWRYGRGRHASGFAWPRCRCAPSAPRAEVR